MTPTRSHLLHPASLSGCSRNAERMFMSQLVAGVVLVNDQRFPPEQDRKESENSDFAGIRAGEGAPTTPTRIAAVARTHA